MNRLLALAIALMLTTPLNAQADQLAAEAQQALADLGCSPGPVDGQWGGRSDAALQRFNKEASLDLSHPLSAEDLEQMRNAGANCPDPTRVPLAGLRGVGINSAVLWSAASTQDYRIPDLVINHFKPIDDFGFSHVAMVSCVDWIIGKPCKKPFQDEQGIIETVRLILDNTDLHVTLSFKGYEQGKRNGKDISTFQKRLEAEKGVQDAFVQQWGKFANEFKDVPRERMSFALLNEPEFQFPSPTAAKRKKWEAIAMRAIKAIREVTPDRVVIYEGIAKSKFNERYKKGGNYKYSISTLMRPLPASDIVYGVHAYEPKKFLDQATRKIGYFGKPYTKQHARMVRNDGRLLADWSKKFGVPVMVTETGCVSHVKGIEGPANPDDCGKFAADAYRHYVEQGIPVVWWAIEKERTIYVREKSDCRRTGGCDIWMPRNRIPDPHLFEAFRLNANP
ncbi:glycoside hydrolase family 5 protein [Hoeflea prorocentri]|uniref:Cellulase family glycosylhydrolase n=1 Tax=Hoeflea prorocentri TaxID=1922333 RepID=A0A9X3ZHY0_9HYPH|nr:cellulase family glycosylhydrolase [Hoeflea prorocentri]MCY6382317.1 cellulase family glycosylhydrolase [Hoeflea prorocentri]MDA5400117.1 cellulase family glycosylhydrolase [Hoeflea prorocentri]